MTEQSESQEEEVKPGRRKVKSAEIKGTKEIWTGHVEQVNTRGK